MFFNNIFTKTTEINRIDFKHMRYDSKNMEQIQIRVKGQVQGVGFRVHVARLAQGYDICGYAKNLDSGSVEIIAQAEKRDVLAALIRRLYQDPGNAVVESFEVHNQRAEHIYEGFEIR